MNVEVVRSKSFTPFALGSAELADKCYDDLSEMSCPASPCVRSKWHDAVKHIQCQVDIRLSLLSEV